MKAVQFYSERLASFFPPSSSTKATKTRRTSARSKKQPAAPPSWPHASPTPEALAFAGFYSAPSAASPDNVACFCCDRHLDGWEADDNPAFEHLTHAPDCGYAINTAIKLRANDPSRVEEDPMSDKMLASRFATFGTYWPHSADSGFPTVEQMAEAGWTYDASTDTLDGATCPYCGLSLDDWEAGDSPFDEHRRRAMDCLFFTLKELYHPTTIPFTKSSQRQSKRVSSQRASTSKKAAPKKAAKATKTTAPAAPARATRKTSRAEPAPIPIEQPKQQPTRGKKRASDSVEQKSEYASTSKRQKPSSPPGPEWSAISSLHPSSIIVSTPSPPAGTPIKAADAWQPIDIDGFFEHKNASSGFLSGILVDSALDKENIDMANTEQLLNNIKASLTDVEKGMTVEQWIMYNAQRGEQKLRAECERMMAAFDVEAQRALSAVETM